MRIHQIIISVIFVLITSNVRSQEIFIKIINPNIEGESMGRLHENEIQALRYAQEATSCGISNAGTGGGVCKITTSSFAFDLNMDKAVIGLRSAMYKNTHIEKVVITFRKPGTSPFEYYKIILANVVISKLTDATNGTSNQFQVQFSAEKYFWISIPQNRNGGAGTPISFGWDSVNNKEWNGN